MANRLIELQTELARHKAPPPARARAGAPPAARPQGLSTGRVARHVRALTQRIEYAVAGTVPAIAQPSSMTCWATATTILMSWRAGRRLDIAETMAEIGTYWRNLFDADQGILPDDKLQFLRDADLEAHAGLNPSPDGWRAMLERYGPIWVTTWEAAGIHGRIVYGIHGDGSAEGTQLDIVDPAGGRRYQTDVATFLPKFEREAATPGRALRVQLVHLKEARSSSQSLRRRLVPARSVRRARALAAVDYEVPGIVPALAQPSSMTCWATSFTMMYSWKEALSVSIPTALEAVGKSYVAMFKANQGLPVDEVDAFAAAAGLGKRPPMSTNVEGYLGLLQDFGPLWVTTDEAPGKPWALHARIIKGIHGDGTPAGTRFSVVDPNGGREYQETIAVFVPKFEELVINAGYAGTQIVHWPAGARLAAERTMSAARALRSSRITRALSDSPSAERLARRFGADTEARVKELLAGGVPEAEIQAFLLQLEPSAAAVPKAEAKGRPLARALFVQEGTTVTLPGGMILEGWKAALLVDAVSAGYPWLALLLPALQELCNRVGVTVGLGPSVGAGVALGPGAGLGLGAGILIAPGNKIGVYGSLEALQGGAALGASAVLQVTAVKGDESRFKGRAYTVGGSIGEGYVGGGRLLLDDQQQPIGLIGEIGVGVGSPVEIVRTIQGTVTSLGYSGVRAFAAVPSPALAIAERFGAEVVAKVQQLKAEGIEDEQIAVFLESLTPEAPHTQSMGYARALDAAAEEVEVHLPGATVYAGWRAQVFISVIDAIGSVVTRDALSVGSLLPLADRLGVTLGLGPAIGGGLGAGGSFGAGLLVAPGNRIGFYGTIAFLNGALASIQATAQGTVVHGGPEVFGGKAMAVGIGIGGAGISPTGGAYALFNDDGFIGVSAEIGVGAGLAPLEVLASFQYTGQTVDAAPPRASAAGLSRSTPSVARFALAAERADVEALREHIQPWRQLIRFRVPQAIVDQLPKRDHAGEQMGRDNIKITVQRIEDARSDNVNLDYYPVYVKKMPTIDGRTVSASEFFSRFRKNINDFLDSDLSEFIPISDSQDRLWQSDDPLGAVLRIDIRGPDNAAVVCSDVGASHWRFSTVQIEATGFPASDATGEHPVSGTREFGFEERAGRAVFYTRGADRSTYRLEAISNRIVFPGAHDLWRSFQRKLVSFVNQHGGEAEEFWAGSRGETYISGRHDWRTVDRLLRTAG